MTSSSGFCSNIFVLLVPRFLSYPLFLVPRFQNMQNCQKWPILPGLCPNSLLCSKFCRQNVVKPKTHKWLGSEPIRMREKNGLASLVLYTSHQSINQLTLFTHGRHTHIQCFYRCAVHVFISQYIDTSPVFRTAN